jgi:hypothetical protein
VARPILIAAGLALASGCAPTADLVLRQPFAPPAQQNIKLSCERAYHVASGDVQTSVLPFPLPGAADGPRTFVVYVTSPNRVGKIAITPHDAQGARGFLIQELGALAGRSDFSEGTVRYQKVLLAPHLRRLELSVRTEDGAEITGRAIVEESPRAVETIEREFAADVAGLAPPADEEAGTSDESEPADELK